MVLLEQGDRTGGALLRRAVPGTRLVLDVGTEAVLARRPEAVSLAREVGLADEVVHPAATRAAIWSRGRLHPVPAGTLMGVPGDPETLRGLLTDDETAFVAGEPSRRHDPVEADVDVASWVAGRVGTAVVERLVEPLLGGVYAGHASRLSLQATVPALWDVATSGGSVLNTVAARTPDPGAPVFAGIRGGVARLAERLEERLVATGVDVRTRACVQALRRDRDRWRLVVGPASAPEVLGADAVMLALPPGRAARLLGDLAPAAAHGLGAIRTASSALCTVVLPAGTLPGLADGSPLSGVLVPPVEGRLVKAMTFSSAKWAWVADAADGRDVVRLSVGRDGEERALQHSDDDLLRAAVDDAGDLLGRRLEPVAGTVTRWGGGLPQYAVGHVDRVRAIRASVAAVPGLAVAGAAFDGVGVAACIASAASAADQVAEVVHR